MKLEKFYKGVFKIMDSGIMFWVILFGMGVPIIGSSIFSPKFQNSRVYIAIYTLNGQKKIKRGRILGSRSMNQSGFFSQSPNKISIGEMKSKVEYDLLKKGAQNINIYTAEEWEKRISLKSQIKQKNCENCGSSDFEDIIDGVKCSYCSKIYKF
ncbi:hypothetical protein [Lactococcus formosensis]|uniref:Uncharacterized protein n=1 Tax=Lactococcus formosensis TaxID=1281486 RepID=A0A9Q8Y4E1_9LACT|nr:hypothetical protein [Lactococcus formosensis]USJ21631.1 hypothetical protein LMK00_12055 [Lactococcus formosensis]